MKLFCVQVVAGLLALPVSFWDQYVRADNLDHLIIENANCYATPERSKSTFTFITHHFFMSLLAKCLEEVDEFIFITSLIFCPDKV